MSMTARKPSLTPGIRRIHRCGALALLATFSAAVVLAQADPAQANFSDQIAVEWVSVSALVEGNRKPVPTLEPGLFRLFVDGREVDIEEFEPAGEIVHLLLLQDVSGSMAMRRRLALSKAAYRRVLDQLQPTDKLAVATFAAPGVELQQAFTEDIDRLRGMEEAWNGWGETALLDAASTIPQLTRSQWGRTTALMVTDGADNASELPPEEVRLLLSGSGIPVYVFGFDGALDERRSRRPKQARDLADFASEEELDDLRKLAVATGGRYVNLTETSVELAVSTVLRDIRRRVFLGFPTTTDSARSMHTVEVRLLRRDGVVRHRTHYFGHEPRNWVP